jgi:hypothetical protein
LDKVGRALYFTALDCASGFHLILIKPGDRCKTAFSNPTGHFEYLRMPFGLKAAPATFQRMMNFILYDLIGDRCFVYMDDVLILGETLLELIRNLKKFSDNLGNLTLRLNLISVNFLDQS